MINSITHHRTARILCAAFITVLTGLSSLHAAETVELKTQPAEPTLSRFAIGAEIGTVGYGPVVVVTASKYFTANLGYTFLNYDYDFSDNKGDYTSKLKFSNLQAIFNYHPFAGTFRLSAGAFICNNKIDATGKAKNGAVFDIGDATYTAAQVGTLSGTVELKKGAVPFVGLGWSKNPSKKGFGCFVDLGVLLMSAPKASLSASGPIATNATFQANLRKEEADVNDELDALKVYPVLQFGLMYRF